MDDRTSRLLGSRETRTTHVPHPAVRNALRSLLRVLADPEASPVALDLVDEVADVVTDLIDVDPPLPPLTYPERGAWGDEHALELVCSAIADLETAVEVSADASERLRTAIAARRLRAVIGRWRQ
ncbi:hypothetical protein FHN55_12400 [Streptomyces sp. NP160]|uniref:hypothetical protein n=1 Tax=Streptomyces sp. NP160 TaxID=2586637 RepID=UPI00111AEAD8|nr:hypothetical protein [Streptomyces sp. NP160]TNM66896.1 hypothetical protein FHN55_12400 [Streptomyces sp. NP160]